VVFLNKTDMVDDDVIAEVLGRGDDIQTTVRMLVDAANARGLGTIHKNAVSLAATLEAVMAALLLEDCVLYDFCGGAAPFVMAEKPVFDAEYPERFTEEGEGFDAGSVSKIEAVDLESIDPVGRIVFGVES